MSPACPEGTTYVIYRNGQLRCPLHARAQGKLPLDGFVPLIHHKGRAAASFLGSVSCESSRGLNPQLARAEDERQDKKAQAGSPAVALFLNQRSAFRVWAALRSEYSRAL